MDYIAPRDMTVSSTSGRSVEFVKGVPTYAPHQMHDELINKGVVPAEDLPEVVVDDNAEPAVGAEREAALFGAIEKVMLRNKRGDFAGTGAPHAAVLAKELGWSSLDAKERDAAWSKFQAIAADVSK
jgi:hypothetical protein